MRRLRAAVGLTHASMVMPELRSRELLSGIVTMLLVPSKERALPYLPLGLHPVPVAVPEFPLPERSVTETPLPSLKP